MSNEEFVRRAYEIAEVRDIPGWIACFNADGVFVDESVGVTYPAALSSGSRAAASSSSTAIDINPVYG
jgi:ketosteroid isomerase-like protein